MRRCFHASDYERVALRFQSVRMPPSSACKQNCNWNFCLFHLVVKVVGMDGEGKRERKRHHIWRQLYLLSRLCGPRIWNPYFCWTTDSCSCLKNVLCLSSSSSSSCRKKRVAELREVARKARFGSVQSITGSDFIREVSQAPPDVWVVVHLYKDGSVLFFLVMITSLPSSLCHN